MYSEKSDQDRMFLISATRAYVPEVASATTNVPLGNLEITKQDKRTKKIINGMEFVVKDAYGNYLTNISNDYVANFNTKNKQYAKKFITGVDGRSRNDGKIYLTNLPTGSYTIEEVGVGNNWQYIVDATPHVKQVNQGSNAMTIENKQYYTRISGYVWKDEASDKTEDLSKINSLYEKNEKLLNGITVKLKDKAGNVIDTKTTKNVRNQSGSYLFDKVLFEPVEKGEYSIEFEYDGLTYQNVPEIKSVNNGSKAKESQRQSFNQNFSIIEGSGNSEGKRLKGFRNGKEDLTYTKINNHVVNLDNVKLKKETDGSLTFNFAGKYKIEADTKTANFNLMNNIEDDGEIRFINLGIYQREQPDMAVIKDLHNVKVAINGVEHTYQYAQRFRNKNKYGDGFDIGVKFGEKYDSMSYTRAIYQSDYRYENVADRGKELEVYITYEIKVRNQSSSLKTKINSIVDYYDDRLEVVGIGTDVKANGDTNGTLNKNYTTPQPYGSSGYNKIIITNNTEIEAKNNNEKSIYVQYRLKRKDVQDIFEGKPGIKDNVAEINSYSIYDKNGIYAGIDKNSNPGNCVPGDKNTYEDDTDQAPSLQLVLQQERKIEGQVFVDGTGNLELQSGKMREGNGHYDNEEEKLKDVTVTLVDKNGQTVEIFDETQKQWIPGITKTKEDGTYSIGGFIPDQYKIVYTWGDKNHKVQEYKSTIVNKNAYETKEAGRTDNALEWYKDRFKQGYPDIEWKNNQEIRVSDAVDNYEERQKIDEQSVLITNQNQKVIEAYGEGTKLEQTGGDKKDLITKINSTTPTFRVNVEYATEPTKSEEEYKTDSQGNVQMTGNYVEKTPAHKNELKSIDFGIVERPRQALELNKDVANVKVILANGTILIDANVVKDRNGNAKLENNVKHTVYLPESAAKGQVKMEVDAEIIQGATLKITYRLRAKNISEVDYLNREFYRYGGKNGNDTNTLVTLNTNEIIDYLDNNIATEEEDESALGKIIQEQNGKIELIDQGLLENTTEMKALLQKTKRVFLMNALTNAALKPIGAENETQTELGFTAYRLLSNISDDEEVSLDNQAEIIKITKSGGSSLVTTTGNYIPSLSVPEYDDDEAENVSIVPPTGLDNNYIAYTLLGISSLGIIVAGIVLIKKFILK